MIKLEHLTTSFDAGPIRSTKELEGIEYEGINIGRGVASSIISFTRQFEISDGNYAELIRLDLIKAANVVSNMKKILRKGYDHVYIFNGRFSECWPVVELCRHLKIPFSTFESGAGLNYELFEGGLPHSILLRHKEINRIWKEANEIEREDIANEWFKRRRNKDERLERSFTKHQSERMLPEGFDKTSRNILILNSSEDEVKSIQEWNTHLYQSQNQAIRDLMGAFHGRSDFTFYLRVHPNLEEVKNVQMEEIRNFNFDNLIVIDPEDPVDTYFLIENCEKSLCFGSTSGIEATYWGKPSILYGNSFYRDQGCVYLPKSLSDLVELVLEKEIPAMPVSSCLPYAYYMSTYGKSPVLFSFSGSIDSEFNGVRLGKMPLKSFWFLARYIKSFRIWRQMHRAVFGQRLQFKDLFKYK